MNKDKMSKLIELMYIRLKDLSQISSECDDIHYLKLFVNNSAVELTEYLNEYLENFYRETNIDIDRFANYHSDNSVSNDYSPLKNDEFSNLNKYLSQCNLWSVERLAFEFR